MCVLPLLVCVAITEVCMLPLPVCVCVAITDVCVAITEVCVLAAGVDRVTSTWRRWARGATTSPTKALCKW